METIFMENNLFFNIFDLQTRLFDNVTLQVGEAQATARPGDKVNHIKWLAGHLVSARYLMANILGANETEKYADFFGEFKGIQPGANYPGLPEVRKEWEKITAVLRPLLVNVSNEVLNSPSPFPIPVTEQTINGFISFSLHHEGYHLGQLGILRKYYGYEPMSYK